MNNDNKLASWNWSFGENAPSLHHTPVCTYAEPVKHLHFSSNLLATLKKNKFAAFNKRIETKGHLIFYDQQ